MANERTAKPKSVFAEITDRLASMTPGQYTCPANKLKDTSNIVGAANDDVRRMYTLSSMLINEHNELVREVARLANVVEQAMRPNGLYGPMAVLRNLLGNLSPNTVDRLEEVIADLEFKSDLVKVAEGLFWLEVKRQFPQTIDKPRVEIFDGWQIGWSEESQTRIRQLFGTLSDDDMPAEIKNLIGSFLRRAAA